MTRAAALAVAAALGSGCTLMPEDSFDPGFNNVGATPAAEGSSTSSDGDDGGVGDAADDGENDDGFADESSGSTGWQPPGEPESTTGGDDGTTPTTTSTTGDDGMADTCGADILNGGVQGSTLGRTNGSSGSCGGDEAPDHAFAFTPAADGLYTFSTNGSSFDTVLYVLDASCAGPELACDDDGGDSVQSSISLALDGGQTVIVVVDGYNANDGAFSLSVDGQTADSCEVTPLAGNVPVSTTGTTSGVSQHEGSCGGGSAPESAFSWVAPQAGTYTIGTAGSDFDTVLHVRDGSCIGPELDCDDDGGPSTQSSLTVSLAANQEIVIFVDGYNTNVGDFVLTIE
ncbi:MAG: hypothetical protein AAGA54_05385 [Myxococcota bacterium]